MNYRLFQKLSRVRPGVSAILHSGCTSLCWMLEVRRGMCMVAIPHFLASPISVPGEANSLQARYTLTPQTYTEKQTEIYRDIQMYTET